ncbi:MAG: CopG family transcriptional regulator [Pseudacidovorax sp.]|uniref:CopG family transcriptional regulator n=1 Tax=Pseudacidovorax sp. TaxID=1934311 RepID=UPI001B78D214|nr:CopG family transcriptional regulator [Pseudacidovorax sp.]MBP6892940.1 CopG family transcriptional regulator [Pseudacidovorax sp.]
MSLGTRRMRLNIFIERDHAGRLDDIAAHRGVSKSSVIAAALSAYLAPDAAQQRDVALTKRLDRLSRQFERLERDQGILIETVALFVRHYLTLALPVPEHQQEAVRAQGRARYAQFIEQLARHVQRGRSLVREVEEESVVAGPVPEDSAGSMSEVREEGA